MNFNKLSVAIVPLLYTPAVFASEAAETFALGGDIAALLLGSIIEGLVIFFFASLVYADPSGDPDVFESDIKITKIFSIIIAALIFLAGTFDLLAKQYA